MRTGEVDDRLMLFSAAQTSMISFLGFPTMKGAGFKLTLDWYTTYGIPF
jgi:hypothetical protein